MYRTYKLKGDEKYVITNWDGDCTSYSVFENQEEMEEEKKRLKKIEDEYNENMRKYLNNPNLF